MGRLFSETTVTAESSRTVTSSSETVSVETVEESVSVPTAKASRPADIRGSLIIYRDVDEESENIETAPRGEESMDISEDSFATASDHERTRLLVEDLPQPLNEIAEEEEE